MKCNKQFSFVVCVCVYGNNPLGQRKHQSCLNYINKSSRFKLIIMPFWAGNFRKLNQNLNVNILKLSFSRLEMRFKNKIYILKIFMVLI